MSVSVCVTTYNRPDGLKHLLDGLNHLEFKKSAIPDLLVIIVDNDPNGLACSYCEQIISSFKWRLEYHIEPQRGISYARNKAIESVADDSDFIAFIDDDEVPEPFWLDELLFIQNSYNADIVTGPVLPQFNHDIPKWIVKGKFFDRPRYPTGTLLEVTYTGNVLISAKVFKDKKYYFDERFSLTGGEDSHFFMRLNSAQYKIVWADNAVVMEWIAKDRTNAKWILMRAYRGGNAYSHINFDLDHSLIAIAARLSKGIFRVLQGLLLVLPSLVAGKHELVRALQKVFLGIGTISALLGVKYHAYRET